MCTYLFRQWFLRGGTLDIFRWCFAVVLGLSVLHVVGLLTKQMPPRRQEHHPLQVMAIKQVRHHRRALRVLLPSVKITDRGSELKSLYLSLGRLVPQEMNINGNIFHHINQRGTHLSMQADSIILSAHFLLRLYLSAAKGTDIILLTASECNVYHQINELFRESRSEMI